MDFLASYINCGGLLDVLFMPFLPDAWQNYILWGHNVIAAFVGITNRWAIVGGCLAILGIIAIVGGISTVKRKRFGLSLAGAICAMPSWILGILAVTFVALGKREFKAEN